MDDDMAIAKIVTVIPKGSEVELGDYFPKYNYWLIKYKDLNGFINNGNIVHDAASLNTLKTTDPNKLNRNSHTKITPIAPSTITYETPSQQRSAMDNIYFKVANDAVDKYYIAKRQGDPIQIYVQAGIVCAAYLQAKDEVNYNKWKQIENEDAIRAGIKK